MVFILNMISWSLIATGSIMLIIGAIGIVRLPDVFARMHAAGIIDTMGLGSIMLGLIFQAGFTIVTIKLGLIVIFIMFTSPTATHALARASLLGGVNPQVEGAVSSPINNDQGDTLSKT
jgi:multicomponent Na+:H+ antiporter subunit G